jgi:uncharacterized protein
MNTALTHEQKISVLQKWLVQHRESTLAIASSGGLDSMTLLVFAHRQYLKQQGPKVIACHATSPAVPAEATQRVQRMTDDDKIPLEIFEAQEFLDPRYIENNPERCYFCKSHLYDAIMQRHKNLIASGTNTDDLSDVRPGLKAAAERNIQHPFVIASMSKHDVRTLAYDLKLSDIAELPSSPCLASRVQTHVAIHGETMKIIEKIEQSIREKALLIAKQQGVPLRYCDVRLRWNAQHAQIQVNPHLLSCVESDIQNAWCAYAQEIIRVHSEPRMVSIAPYEQGSARLKVFV